MHRRYRINLGVADDVKSAPAYRCGYPYMEKGIRVHEFTELLAQLPGLHWWQNREGDRYAFSPSCSSLVGKHEQLCPQEWQSFVHPHDQPRRNATLDLPLNQEISIEYRLLMPDGTYQWVQESIKHIQSADAGPVLLSTAVTCTAPVYHSIFNNTSLFMVLVDLQGNIQELNKTSEQFLGQAWEQGFNKPFWNSPVFQKEGRSADKIKQAIQKAARGQLVNHQEWVLSYDGHKFYGNFCIRPIYGAKASLQYLMIEGNDISLQRQADQQWHMLAGNIPDVIVRYDRQFRYLFANPAIEGFTGEKPEFFIGKSASEIKFSNASWNGFEECLKLVLQNKEMQTYKGLVINPQQEQRNIYSLLVPELDEKEEVSSILVITRDVTELAEKEKALEQTNAKLRAILESTPDLIYAFDTQKRLITFNAAFEEEIKLIFDVQVRRHMALEEMLAQYPAELKNASDLLSRALQGEEFTILQEFGDPSRVRNYYEISFSSIRDEAGQLTGASSRTRNISRDHQIEKELKDAHEFLVLAENLPQIIFTARPDGQIDYLNQAFFDYTNLSNKQAEEVDWQQVLHPDDYGSTLHQWLEAVRCNAPGMQQELRLRNRHGLYRWHIARAVPLYSSQQVPIKWVGVISDVHEAKIAGELERLAAEEFKTISESLPHIVWTTRADGQITYFNNKWYEYTGEDHTIINEWDWIKYIHPEDKLRTQKAWNKALTSSTQYQVEYRLRHKSGRYRWFLARGVPVTNAAGNVSKWFGTCTDIHENKLQRKRLQTQNERLNQINQYLDNFVHAAAHDLRSPVANMKGLLQLLRTDGKDKGGKIMQSMEICLYRLDNTLQAMIHSIELQSLKQSPASELNLKEVFNQVLQEFSERIQVVPHEVHTNFDECETVIFIPFYLESLFRNLLSNAIKYRKDDEKLVIKVSCRTYRSYKLIEFSDNGIGIDVEKHKNKLFRPFQRFTQQAGGKGIGLHLINNIVTKTGGKIEVKSKPGHGTTFLMYLKDLEA